jgi:hypothetical protein
MSGSAFVCCLCNVCIDEGQAGEAIGGGCGLNADSVLLNSGTIPPKRRQNLLFERDKGQLSHDRKTEKGLGFRV